MTQEPALVLTYGPSGCGKTTDCGFSFPNALFIATQGALQSIQNTCGYVPTSMDVDSIQDATKLILSIKDKGYDSVVVDDFSFLTEKTFAKLEKKFKGFQLWGELREVTLEFRNAARYAGVHVVLNCWEKSPRKHNDGSFVRGGPMLSGKLPEQLPAMCDLVLRCGRDMNRKPWSGVYKCELSQNYVMKDRFNVCYDLNPIPMNLAEILRSVGLQVTRLKGLEWQEEIVEQMSNELANSDIDLVSYIESLYTNLIQNGIDQKHVRWTIRDVLDRTVIKRTLLTKQERFFA